MTILCQRVETRRIAGVSPVPRQQPLCSEMRHGGVHFGNCNQNVIPNRIPTRLQDFIHFGKCLGLYLSLAPMNYFGGTAWNQFDPLRHASCREFLTVIASVVTA